MHTGASTPTVARRVPNHASFGRATATGYLMFYTAAQAVGEMLFLTEASDPYLTDIQDAPLGAVEKTETHTGRGDGTYRMITDLEWHADGTASANSVTEKRMYPPSTCPTHQTVVLKIRYNAYLWPRLPHFCFKRDVLKAYQQLYFSIACVNYHAASFPGLFAG